VAVEVGLDRGLLVAGDHVLVRAEGFVFVGGGVQVKDALGLGAEVRVPDEDPGPVLPGSDGVLPQPAAHGGRRDAVGNAAGGQLGGQFRARPPRQRHPGLGRELAGQGLGLGDLHGGEAGWVPVALAVGQGRQAALGKPTPPGAHRVHVYLRIDGDTCVGPAQAAKSTIHARNRAWCGVLCPQAAFFSRCRSVAVRTIGRAEVTGKAGGPIDRSGCLGSSEGPVRLDEGPLPNELPRGYSWGRSSTLGRVTRSGRRER
jgi:hypothetical protein